MTVAGQAAVTYGYDDADRLTSITQRSSVVGFEYDGANRRTAVTLPNGVRVEYGYTASSRLAALTYKYGTTVLGTLAYEYDAAGRRIEMSGTWARTTLPAPLTSATYAAANRLTQWNGTTLTYDDNGNLASEGSRTYSWDVRNRLTALGGPQPASFQYDAFGRRISKSTAAGTTEYLYDGAEAVQKLTGGSPSANLLYGPGIDELLFRTTGATVRWLVADGLGSALALIESRRRGADAVHLRRVRRDERVGRSERQRLAVHRPRERRHGAVLLPGAVLQSAAAAVRQRGSDWV
jgi:YD repeat-containing protein